MLNIFSTYFSRRSRLIYVLVALLSLALIAPLAKPALATQVCNNGDSITMSPYWLNSNLWGISGASGSQCITSNSQSGSTISWSTTWNWSGASNTVKTYDSSVLGWHWGWKLSGTGLPVQISANHDVPTSWSFNVSQSGSLDISYDIWTSANPNLGNANPDNEVMIWLYNVGGIQPVGSSQMTVNLDGSSWTLWRGNTSWQVMSFVHNGNITSASLNIKDFLNELVSLGWISSSQYLISVEQGTEIFVGNGTLNTTSYSTTIGGTSSGPTATTPPTSVATATPQPTNTQASAPTNTPVATSSGPTPTPPPSGSSLTVGIDKGGGTDNNQETTFNYVIKNNGSSAASNLSTRIYFTADGSNPGTGYTLEKYYDQSGVATISGPTLASGSTYYFTVNYGSASLGAGAQWEFQTALHLSSWGSTYDGSNDWYHTGYAVGALPASYTNTNYIPAYVNGSLVWGSVPGGSTAPTATNAPTNTFVPPSATAVNTVVGPSATPVPPTKTNTPAPTSSGGGTCTPNATISAPFTFDGAGTLCWKTNSLGSYINSWNLASLTINGTNITNLYVASGNYPAKASDGYWYISYNSTVSYGHFETK